MNRLDHRRATGAPPRVLALGALLFVVACAPKVVRTETTVSRAPGSGAGPVLQGATSSRVVDGKTIASLREEWETEFISATGTAPLVTKYPDAARNKELARRGAVLDAQRNLAAQVSKIRVTATVTMADLETSDFARSQMNAVLQDVEVISERFEDAGQRWIVEARMPKVKLIRFIEEVAR